MNKYQEEEKENNERWLLTYSDLITLLMIFFVMMYSISSLNMDKYNNISKYLNIALGNGQGALTGSGGSSMVDLGDFTAPTDTPASDSDITRVPASSDNLTSVKDALKQYFSDNGLNDYAGVYLDDRGLAIRLKDSVLFDSGKADIKEDLFNKLVKIGNIINKIDTYIRVEGHTDNMPINNQYFKSNWQLSSVRAANVAELLVTEAKLPPDKVSAVGYGEFRPISDNSTAEGRSKNRRVEIVLINSKLSDSEKSN